MIIPARNTLSETAPKTYLSSAITAGATTSPVRNTAGLTAGWAVQIGETGEELSEVLIGTNASGTSITHPASAFNHPADTPVYFIKYNQVVFERSTAGTAGTAAPLTNGTITYQADSLTTIFDDTSGTPAYAYKTYFRNSALAVNSIESDWTTSSGFSFYSLARIRDRIKKKLWNFEYIKEDSIIDDWINEWKDEMSNAVTSLNADYALGTVDVPFGTNGLGTITTADFKDVRRVWVTYDGINNYQSTKMSINDFEPAQTFIAPHPYHAFLGDNILQIKPSDQAGTVSLVISRFGTTMVNDTDELPVPFRAYTKSFVDYGLSQAKMLDEKPDWKDLYGIAQNAKLQFVAEMSPRDKSGPTYIDVVEPTASSDGLEDTWW